MGDFNYPLVDWQHEIPVMESDGTDRFLELFHQSYLYQHVTFPTRYRNDQAANILDLVMTNEEYMISDINSLSPVGNSDHVVLSWKLNCYSEVHKCEINRHLYEKGNFDAIRRELKTIDWEDELFDLNTEETWQRLKVILGSLIDTYVPHVKLSRGKRMRTEPKWLKEDLKKKIRDKRRLFNQYRISRDARDYSRYKKIRNQVKSETRIAVRRCEKEIASQAKKNPKLFYKYVNDKMKVRHGVQFVYNQQNEPTCNNLETAEELNKFFGSVFVDETAGDVPVPRMQTVDKLNTVDIGFDEVRQLLS